MKRDFVNKVILRGDTWGSGEAARTSWNTHLVTVRELIDGKKGINGDGKK